jgi:hypothetical protein
MKHFKHYIKYPLICFLIITGISCLDDYNKKPELESLRQGIRTSAAVGYCTSIVYAAMKGYTLPNNVTYNGSGLIYIHIDAAHPLPFNSKIGDITIAFTGDNTGGVMSILFGNIDIIGGNIKLYGLETIPFMVKNNTLCAIYAKEDIVLGKGSNTLLDMGNISVSTELSRLTAQEPTDSYIAIKQNVWFIDVDPNGTYSNVYDDDITVNGGGQIAEVEGESGGVIYHGMIGLRMNYSVCKRNPVSGLALSQNFKGGSSFIDLGNSLLEFKNNCDGKVHVNIATGKYTGYSGKDVSLGVN